MGKAIVISGISFSSRGLGTVTPSNTTPVELTGLFITGSDSITSGNTAVYTADYTPSNTTKKGVTWSITSGTEYATIDTSTGRVTVAATATSAQSVTIKAVSTKNSSIVATKTISVTYDSSSEEGGAEDGTPLFDIESATMDENGRYKSGVTIGTGNDSCTILMEISKKAAVASYELFMYNTALRMSLWAEATTNYQGVWSIGTDQVAFAAFPDSGTCVLNQHYKLAIKISGNTVYISKDGSTWSSGEEIPAANRTDTQITIYGNRNTAVHKFQIIQGTDNDISSFFA